MTQDRADRRHFIDMRPAALAIGRRFAPVYPTRNGRPCCAHGVHDASRDPETIKKLWARYPGANISVAMGRVSGLLGLDVDMKGGRDGKGSLAALEAAHGPLPRTPHYNTPNGGLGYLFRHPGGEVRTRFDFLPGLELKSDGAALTLPPSAKRGRPYVWHLSPAEAQLADPPAWLLKITGPPPAPTRAARCDEVAPSLRTANPERLAKYVAAALDRECGALARMGKDTGRNRALFVAACRLGELVGADMLPQDLVESELEIAAQACGLVAEDGWRSVRATIASGMQRGLRQPREVAL